MLDRTLLDREREIMAIILLGCIVVDIAAVAALVMLVMDAVK